MKYLYSTDNCKKQIQRGNLTAIFQAQFRVNVLFYLQVNFFFFYFYQLLILGETGLSWTLGTFYRSQKKQEPKLSNCAQLPLSLKAHTPETKSRWRTQARLPEVCEPMILLLVGNEVAARLFSKVNLLKRNQEKNHEWRSKLGLGVPSKTWKAIQSPGPCPHPFLYLLFFVVCNDYKFLADLK